VSEVINISKMDVDRQPLSPQQTDLAALVDDVTRMFAPECARKGIFCRVETDVDGPRLADPTKLRQVLINLLGNATRLTTEGGIVLRLTDANGGNVLFAVEDTGPGIASENLPHVFSPFWRQSEGGSGLGLTITKRHVQLMGGELSVDSTPGAGTTFRFTLGLGSALALSHPGPPHHPSPRNGIRR
jgi:signal transduction histidine kinase